MFRGNISPPSSESKNKQSKKQREGGLLAWLCLLPAKNGFLLGFIPIQKMDTIYSSETSINFQRLHSFISQTTVPSL
jgi:hypothetical protein